MPNGQGTNSLVCATSIGAEGKMALGMSKAELRRYAAATSERDAGIAQQELNVALEDGILEPHERIELNLKQTGRLLHQNSNSAAGAGRRRAAPCARRATRARAPCTASRRP